MAEGPEAITGIPGLRCDLAQLRSPISDHILELIRWHGHVDVQVAEPETPLKPGQAHVAFLVDNLDAALAKVESLGAKRLGGLFVLPGYRSVYVREPSGSFIELEETNET
jgi:catechol 2,3-dioxygenase-like lactoylglutathione lyase family enzyme